RITGMSISAMQSTISSREWFTAFPPKGRGWIRSGSASSRPVFVSDEIMKIRYGYLFLLAGALLGCNRSGVVMPETYGPRPPHEGSSPYSDRVIAYVPAPGQFINNDMVGFGGDEATGQDALDYADRRLHASDASQRGMVSLGGFGGYIVVGFDHSIQASGGYSGYDFSITGNQFSGSSEPGVVWVMPDTNGNG